MNFLFGAVLFCTVSYLNIGMRIWQNECGGTIEGLTSWNKGEEFPSLGIGHFIWYVKGKEALFQESFPELLIFFEKRGVVLPTWLKGQGAPWSSREEFLKEFHSDKMRELRDLLHKTVDLQVDFMRVHLEKANVVILENINYQKLIQTEEGLYALMDYLNFKGEGTSVKERYRGEGWGLLQVLEKMDPLKPPLKEFVRAAKEVLIRRVENSPAERNEKRWLKGWLKRVESYFTKCRK